MRSMSVSESAPSPICGPRGRRERRPRRRFEQGAPWRSRSDRVFTGLSGGIAEWSGLPSVVVRIVFVGLAASTGLGALAYVVGSAVVPVSDASVPPERRRLDAPRGADLERSAAVGLVMLGGALLLRRLGLRLGGSLAVPAALAGIGFALVWSRTAVERREQWRTRVARLPAGSQPATSRRALLARLACGGLLLLAGGASFLATASPSALGQVLAAMAATAGGLAVLAGPWILRLWRDLADERRERIRSEEFAEVAAHLHDSVLQTLALVQRNPETPRDVARLVRRQERELRGWLYPSTPRHARPGVGVGPPTLTIAEAIRTAVAEAEEQHEVEAEVVTVGDAPLDDRLMALTMATREVVANAARHSGTSEVSIYLEVDPAVASVYVRDRGCGFDPARVASDRHGLRDSVSARLARHGGSAVVNSVIGEGTEIVLQVPR
ncbi:MAG: putative two-component system sensor kinase [Acidimicrobiales bacterium]|nr:putative two-component system sensor kinase [Acidimicrobiales bacterium]